MLDLIMLALLFATFVAAWGYARACADLSQPSSPPDGDT